MRKTRQNWLRTRNARVLVNIAENVDTLIDTRKNYSGFQLRGFNECKSLNWFLIFTENLAFFERKTFNYRTRIQSEKSREQNHQMLLTCSRFREFRWLDCSFCCFLILRSNYKYQHVNHEWNIMRDWHFSWWVSDRTSAYYLLWAVLNITYIYFSSQN